MDGPGDWVEQAAAEGELLDEVVGREGWGAGGGGRGGLGFGGGGHEGLPVGAGLAWRGGGAAGLAVLDGVYLDLGDAEGLEASCGQGVALGFDGKTLIHPKQLAAANAAFAPTEAAVARARKIVAAFQAAQAEGQGVVLVDGRLVENLHVVAAQRMLALHDAIEAR